MNLEKKKKKKSRSKKVQNSQVEQKRKVDIENVAEKKNESDEIESLIERMILTKESALNKMKKMNGGGGLLMSKRDDAGDGRW